ncbi:MAG: hypothetical protein ISP88_11455 [Pseudomonadales bacterium]|nr:hypothetical protein [Pseudomonadales bacterium]
MNEKKAKILACILLAMSIFGFVNSVLIDQSIFFALSSIAGIFTFLFALENPKLLLSSSWKEFGERVDVATGKEKITGTPWYYATVFFAVLYIILV